MSWADAGLLFFGIFFFLLPALGLIGYTLLVPAFVPSNRLVTMSWYAAGVGALAYLALFSSFLVPRVTARFADVRWRDGAAAWGLVVAAPVFGALLWLLSVFGPLSYGLHRLEGPVQAKAVERVVSADSGRRYCSNRIRFRSSSAILAREFCGLPSDAIEALSDGGTIELLGPKSSYGIQVQQYRYRPARPPAGSGEGRFAPPQ